MIEPLVMPQAPKGENDRFNRDLAALCDDIYRHLSFQREKHDDYLASDDTPQPVAASGSSGTGTQYARDDHEHALERATGYSILGPNSTTPEDIATAAAVGASGYLADAAHVHNLPASTIQSVMLNENLDLGTGDLDAYDITSDGIIYMADGSASHPSLTKTSDTNTGFYHEANNQIGVAFSGTRGAVMLANGLFYYRNDSISFQGYCYQDNLTDIVALRSYRGAGTEASPDAIEALTRLIGIYGYGHDGSDFRQSATIFARVPAGEVIQTNKVPSEWVFETTDSTGSRVENMILDHDGNLTVTGTVNGITLSIFGDLTEAEINQLENIGATTISAGQWGYLGALDQALATSDSPTFGGLTVNNVIEATGFQINASGTGDAAQWAFRVYDGIGSIMFDIYDPWDAADNVVMRNNSGGDIIFSDGTNDTMTIEGGAAADTFKILAAGGISVTGNITVSGTVDGVDVAALESDVDGFPDELKNLVTAEIQQLENIGAVTISNAQWAYLGDFDQALTTGSNVEFVNINATGVYNMDGTTRINSSGQIRAADGDGTHMGLGFASDDDTGFYLDGSGYLSAAYAGTTYFKLIGSTINFYNGNLDLDGNNIVDVGTVDGVDVAGLKSDVDGFPDELKNLVTAEIQQLENIGAVTISNAQWAYLGDFDQALTSASNVAFGDVAATGDVTGANLNISNWDDAYSHVSADGSSHSYIDQDVTQSASPTFAGLTVNDTIEATGFQIKETSSGTTARWSIRVRDSANAILFDIMDAWTANYNVMIRNNQGGNILFNDGTNTIMTVEGGAAADTLKLLAAGGISVTGNIQVSGTVDGVDVAALESDVDGFPDELKNLVTAEIQQLENIGATTISAAQWANVGAMDQDVDTTATPSLAGLTISGAGSAAAPSFKMVDSDLGFYKIGTHQIGVACNGGVELEINPNFLKSHGYVNATGGFYVDGTQVLNTDIDLVNITDIDASGTIDGAGGFAVDGTAGITDTIYGYSDSGGST